ncbi:single-stranded DNA-binding protein [Fibrobacter sp. UWEL]|uniref:single-stranded DNA-binding protein n=1 Tax=Fibrobacter sp. UWEL TaxID=1896209 RepID=UPI0009214C87|nr:single-stranded DNA-binding protein [Fibrobacter sp. UWEL]SHK47252.1 single-strand binding protein [Fibrobacter sp. UWEL]
MAYLNKVMLIGNVGKDPVISAGATGRKRVSFSLATSRRYRDNNGEQKEQTDWHNIVGWGKVADTMEQLGVKKGTTLYVEGSLTNRSWTDQSGQKRYSTEVSLDTFQLLSSRSSNGGQSGSFNQAGNSYSQSNNFNQQSSAPAYDAPMPEEEDGLPF